MPEDLSHSVIILPIRGARIALAERLAGSRMAGTFASPGGSIDPEDASIPAAAQRELLEETGLKVEPRRLLYLGKLVATGEDWQPVGGHFFLLRVADGEELQHTEPGQHGPWKWYTYQEAARLRLPPVSQPMLLLLAQAGAPG